MEDSSHKIEVKTTSTNWGSDRVKKSYWHQLLRDYVTMLLLHKHHVVTKNSMASHIATALPTKPKAPHFTSSAPVLLKRGVTKQLTLDFGIGIHV
jgi:hypothetical protein